MGELEIFPIRIKELRDSLKMTQKSFSEYIGIKQQTLSGYERGIMKPPLDIIMEIAKKCHVSIDWLCGLSDYKELDKKFQTYSDVLNALFSIDEYALISIGHEFEHEYNTYFPYLTFQDKTLNDFLAEWFEASNVLNNSSINKETAKAMYELWKKSKIEEFSKIDLEEKSSDNTTT